MKTLYIVRHAKSSWKHDVQDHQRPLKSRGKNDAKLISKWASEHLKTPQKIISSNAVRASSTAAYFKKSFHISDSDYMESENMYDFSGHEVMEVIKNLDDALEIVMLFGHNHAFTSIANMLGNKYIDNVPTCGLVIIEFKEEQWSKITTGTTINTMFPRNLK